MTIDVSLTQYAATQTPYGEAGGFSPAVTTVAVGTQIHFVNLDNFANTATAIPGATTFPAGSPFNGSALQQKGTTLSGGFTSGALQANGIVADDYRRSTRYVSLRLFLPLRRTDASRDRCAVSSPRPRLHSSSSRWGRRPARAIPIFAQRYHFKCGQCHSVLPELNAFGNYFRSHGYRLPLPEHGTTIFAIRYQLEYDEHPAPDTREFTPGGILLGSGNIGPITAYLHYNFGAGGGPAATYLLFGAGYNEHTQTLYRGGLFELPLAQSPGQRLDDLEQYGYYGAHVGLNNLPLSSPRWGLMAERTFGKLRADVVVDFGFYAGSAYGGKPVPTGEFTWMKSPETSVWLRDTLAQTNKS